MLYEKLQHEGQTHLEQLTGKFIFNAIFHPKRYNYVSFNGRPTRH